MAVSPSASMISERIASPDVPRSMREESSCSIAFFVSPRRRLILADVRQSSGSANSSERTETMSRDSWSGKSMSMNLCADASFDASLLRPDL